MKSTANSIPRAILMTVLCCVLALTSAAVALGASGVCQRELGFAQQAHAASTISEAKRIKASGWYRLQAGWVGIWCKGAYIGGDGVNKLKNGRAIKNGRLTSNDVLSLIDGKSYSGARKFKVAKKVKYGKFKISNSMGKLGKTKTLSRAAFYKKAMKKSVYWLMLKVEKGVVTEVRWMPLSSVEMLD